MHQYNYPLVSLKSHTRDEHKLTKSLKQKVGQLNSEGVVA